MRRSQGASDAAEGHEAARSPTPCGSVEPPTVPAVDSAASASAPVGDAPMPRRRGDGGVIVGDDGLARPAWASSDPLLREYYDTEWGMPIRDDRGMFERLSLEAFQSGLSWSTILRKRPAFRAAFHDFEPEVVAQFGPREVARLMADAAILRNRPKIDATIANATATVRLRDEGGLARIVWSFRPDHTPAPKTTMDIGSTSPESIALAKHLKARGFKFVGPTTMFALMEAVGIVDTHLIDSHRRGTSGVWTDERTARG